MSLHLVLQEYLKPENNLRILDLCAAPGGKSTLIAAWMKEHGLLVANEVIRSRAGILAENLVRWGASNVIVSNNDPRQFGKLEGFFDVVVTDAPCSGSGMFRKDPDAKAHWSVEAVKHCAARQNRILTDIWPALKEDGILIYSTCSYSEEEDEQIVLNLCEETGAELLEIRALELIPGIVKTNGGYRFYPGLTDGEGLFISAVRKRNPVGSTDWRMKNKPVKVPDVIAGWMKNPESFILDNSHLGDTVVPASFFEVLPLIMKHLHIVKSGISAGEMKGKNYLPSHDLALSNLLNDTVPRHDLSREEALRFLKKEALPGVGDKKGYHLMSYKNLALGWGNLLPGRINNYLPKSWRIRKELEF
jgi:NOL1/NOP2/fmu family ribosome biogenesis protein